MSEAQQIAAQAGYTAYRDAVNNNEAEPQKRAPKIQESDEPYIITADDYGDMQEYETIELTFYAGDGVVSDDQDEEIDDPTDIIGIEAYRSLESGEYDAVYVRNDKRKCDYEIVVDHRDYYDSH